MLGLVSIIYNCMSCRYMAKLHPLVTVRISCASKSQHLISVLHCASSKFYFCCNCSWCVVLCLQDDPEDFVEEQGLMGRVVNLFQADAADDQYLVSRTFARNLRTASQHTIHDYIHVVHIMCDAVTSLEHREEAKQQALVLMSLLGESSWYLVVQSVI